jgi:hypothetical protein
LLAMGAYNCLKLVEDSPRIMESVARSADEETGIRVSEALCIAIASGHTAAVKLCLPQFDNLKSIDIKQVGLGQFQEKGFGQDSSIAKDRANHMHACRRFSSEDLLQLRTVCDEALKLQLQLVSE